MPQLPRYDHVGSMLRPLELRQARERLLGVHDADHNLNAHNNSELRLIEDRFIRDAIRLQEEAGMPYVTDGEFRRRSWWSDFLLGFSGTQVTYNGKNPVMVTNAAGEKRPAPGIRIGGRLQRSEAILVEPFKFLKSESKTPAKVTLPGPAFLHFQREDDFVPAVYKSLDEFWSDVVDGYRREIKAVGEAGCTYVQIDECMLPMLCDPRHQAYARSRGDDPEKLIKLYADVTNKAIADRPKGMIIGLHLCRGNMNAFWTADGGYEVVADAIFNRIDADVYLLEYDTPRAGDFQPLRHVPKGKRVLLGLISTKDKALEDPDQIVRKIDEAAKHVDHDQLGLCPQCGFSTNMFGTHFTIDDEKRKMELVTNIAKKVWN